MIHRRHIREALEAMRSLIVRLLVVSMISAPISGYAEDAGGGDGGGGGGAAAGILQGIAANIQAAAPIAVAGIQAAADKQIAGINAAANVKMTQIASDTSKYLADIQSEVALYQAKTAQNINLQNQEGQTDRLGMQLNELRTAREEQLADNREKLRYEKYLNDQRIRLAYQQEADNVKLARMTLQSQQTQNGFSSGFTDMNSGARLKVTRTLSSGAPIPTGVMNAQVVMKGPSQTSRPQQLPPMQAKVGGATTMRGVRATAPKGGILLSRLMASIKQPGFTSMRAGKVLSRGMGMMRFASVGGPLRGLLEEHLAAGSTAGLRHRISDAASAVDTGLIAGRSPASQSDLTTFHAAVQSPGERHRGALSGSAPEYSTDPASFGSSEVPSSVSGGGHRGHSGRTH